MRQGLRNNGEVKRKIPHVQSFYSFKKLNEIISDPKRDTVKVIFKWRPIQHFYYQKVSSEPFSFYFKATLDEEFPFTKCICPQKNVGRPIFFVKKVFRTNLNSKQKIKLISSSGITSKQFLTIFRLCTTLFT